MITMFIMATSGSFQELTAPQGCLGLNWPPHFLFKESHLEDLYNKYMTLIVADTTKEIVVMYCSV